MSVAFSDAGRFATLRVGGTKIILDKAADYVHTKGDFLVNPA